MTWKSGPLVIDIWQQMIKEQKAKTTLSPLTAPHNAKQEYITYLSWHLLGATYGPRAHQSAPKLMTSRSWDLPKTKQLRRQIILQRRYGKRFLPSANHIFVFYTNKSKLTNFVVDSWCWLFHCNQLVVLQCGRFGIISLSSLDVQFHSGHEHCVAL